MARLFRIARPRFWSKEDSQSDSIMNYRRLWALVVTVMLLVSIVPLCVMSFADFSLSREKAEADNTFRVSRLVSNSKHTIANFIEERRAALEFVVSHLSRERLSDQAELGRVLLNLKRSFGGVYDIGFVDSSGMQLAYSGPLNLTGRDYSSQDWFREVLTRGVYISPVFRGFRDVPHMVIAIKHDDADGDYYILRATLDTARFNDLLLSLNIWKGGDIFIMDRQGILQTPTRRSGRVLQKAPYPVPAYSDSTKLIDIVDSVGHPMTMGYAYIKGTPYILTLVTSKKDVMNTWWEARLEILGFSLLSIWAIVFVVLGVSSTLVSRVYDADQRRMVAMHNAEHSNKMASIGRLAAGVAHEVNNPLAVINEKAGLMKDLLSFGKSLEDQKEKFLKLTDSILASVQRCGTITHRLLGFARHIDVRLEELDIEPVVREVLSFLEKEAEYRGLEVYVDTDPDVPPVNSDRGQLQQVFLNIVNNAFAAVDDGGRINIGIRNLDARHVIVDITDNGCGITEEHLKHIFEPFFSTKGEKGTGLGLSITYGLVQKLGAEMTVDSTVGVGTTFHIVFPVKS